MKLDPLKTGLGLGTLAVTVHLIWVLMVLVGLAQWYMDWIFSLHFLNNPFNVHTFDFMTALTLLIVAGGVGFIVGWVFAYIWNYLQKK